MMRTLVALALVSLCLGCAKHAPPAATAAPPRGTSINWVDLIPDMQLRVENAYFKTGSARVGIADYMGTEVARFQVARNRGLRPTEPQSTLPQRPAEQPAALALIPNPQRRHRQYSFYYAVVFTRKGSTSGSVLLGADSPAQMDRLSADLLASPDSVCTADSTQCTVFPSTCTASIEMPVIVNGVTQQIAWRTQLFTLTRGAKQIELIRRVDGRAKSTMIDPNDSQAMRTQLMPADRVNWN